MLVCVECGATTERGHRWRACLAYDPREDEHAYAVIYCPSCAEREFGSERKLANDQVDDDQL